MDMEKGKNTCRQDRRKTQVGSCGGGNVGGLVLLGGALAVASLVATFTFQKANKRRDANQKSRNRQRQGEEQASPGLRVVLQTSSPAFHANPCCASNGSTKMVQEQTDSSTSMSTNCLISEENPSPAINTRDENSNNGDQQILIDSDSNQDSIKLCDNDVMIEEFSLPKMDCPSMHELEKEIQNYSAEKTPLMDTTEVAEEVAMDVVKMSAEKISLVQSVEGKDDDNYDNEEKEDEAKEELLLQDRMEEIAEEELTDSMQISSEKTSLHLVEQDNGDDNFRKGSQMMEITEVRKDKEAADDAPQMSADIKLSEYSIEEEEDDDDYSALNEGGDDDDYSALNEGDDYDDDCSALNEDDEGNNEEFVMKKSEENSEGRGSSSAGSNADEIWPAESIEELSQKLKNTLMNLQPSMPMEKTKEADQNKKTEEFAHFNNGKINVQESCRDNNQITQNLTFLKKGENYQSKYLRVWRILFSRAAALAFIMLLLFIIYFLN